MHLVSIKIRGYKRFAEEQLLYLGPRVVAVVGPNEAGKTTLLAALKHVTDGVGFERREFAGRQSPDEVAAIVSARYNVEPDDREGLESILDKATSYTLTLTVFSDGAVRWTIDPRIVRDVGLRSNVMKALSAANEREALVARLPAPGDAADEADETDRDDEVELEVDTTLASQADALTTLLAEASEDLDEEEQQQIVDLRAALAARRDGLGDPEEADRLVDQLTEVERVEAEENPRRRAYAVLRARVPSFLMFDDEQLLRSDYVWADYPAAPPGLGNLLYLAGATYDKYRELATDRERRDELSTYERQLNRELKDRLAIWSQHELTVTLRADPESLAVHVTDEDTDRDVPIEERSAGLQMFAALLAFSARFAENVPPILLFDEAETHLHYGAQADLVQVFEQQDVAQAVVYTTHSIGCLPEDLGRSIRVVAPTGNEKSEIRNEFWSGGVGLTPLTLAMGASALAVLPARYAVIGEGPTEAILFPSLFRATRDKRYRGHPLGFQLAPGGAEVSAEVAPDLETEAGNVAYLFDADEGGRAHAAKLAERAHHEGRVFVLGENQEPGLCTEDLVAAETYTAAVNDVLDRTRDTDARIVATDLPECGRAAHVESWCEKRGVPEISKTLVAEAALRISEKTGELVEPLRRDLLAKLYRDLRKAVGLK